MLKEVQEIVYHNFSNDEVKSAENLAIIQADVNALLAGTDKSGAEKKPDALSKLKDNVGDVA